MHRAAMVAIHAMGSRLPAARNWGVSLRYFPVEHRGRRNTAPARNSRKISASRTTQVGGQEAFPILLLMSDDSIARLRKSYERAELNESAAHDQPLQQFGQWLHEAIQARIAEPNAMTLATVGTDGRPSTRIVLIKGYDEQGLIWYTNYESRKGRELAAHPFAALQFHWVELERVVRIEGRTEKLGESESDAYFASRPLDSRIGAWASPQSQVIMSRAVLVANAARYAARYGLHPPRPPHWGGYRLLPDRWEFWQGRKSRLHDRLCYRLVDGKWVRERLAP
jgi:pyridoxamine 5'-phosphate oxidase